MTFREKVAHAAKDDPKFGRAIRRAEVASVVFGVGLLLAMGVGAYAVLVNRSQGKDITKVTRKVDSACERRAVSDRCQHIQRRADERRTVASACVLFEKVDDRGRLLRLTRCGRPVETVADRVAAPGGDALQPGSTGSQPSGPRGGGGGAGKGGGGRNPSSPGKAPSQPKDEPGTFPSPSPAPGSVGSPPPAAASSPGNSNGAGRSESAPVNPVAEGAGKAVEGIGGSVGGVVKEAGGSVNSAAGGIGEVAQGGVCGTVEAPGCER